MTIENVIPLGFASVCSICLKASTMAFGFLEWNRDLRIGRWFHETMLVDDVLENMPWEGGGSGGSGGDIIDCLR